MIENGFANHILLRADQAHIGNRNGRPSVKEAAHLHHVCFQMFAFIAVLERAQQRKLKALIRARRRQWGAARVRGTNFQHRRRKRPRLQPTVSSLQPALTSSSSFRTEATGSAEPERTAPKNAVQNGADDHASE